MGRSPSTSGRVETPPHRPTYLIASERQKHRFTEVLSKDICSAPPGLQAQEAESWRRLMEGDWMSLVHRRRQ